MSIFFCYDDVTVELKSVRSLFFSNSKAEDFNLIYAGKVICFALFRQSHANEANDSKPERVKLKRRRIKSGSS